MLSVQLLSIARAPTNRRPPLVHCLLNRILQNFSKLSVSKLLIELHMYVRFATTNEISRDTISILQTNYFTMKRISVVCLLGRKFKIEREINSRNVIENIKRKIHLFLEAIFNFLALTWRDSKHEVWMSSKYELQLSSGLRVHFWQIAKSYKSNSHILLQMLYLYRLCWRIYKLKIAKQHFLFSAFSFNYTERSNSSCISLMFLEM